MDGTHLVVCSIRLFSMYSTHLVCMFYQLLSMDGLHLVCVFYPPPFDGWDTHVCVCVLLASF